MAWIESHQSLGTHKKLFHLAKLLHINRPQAVGHLHYLWWWTLDNAPNGNLSDVPIEVIADVSEWHGDPAKFRDALLQAGWLDPTGQLHDWDDYAGRFIAQKQLSHEQRRQGGLKRMEMLAPNARSMLAQQASRARWDANRKCQLSSDSMPATLPNRTIPNIKEIYKENINFPNFEGEPDPGAMLLWQKALEELKTLTSTPNFHTWLDKTCGLAFAGDEFVLGVPTGFVGDYLNQNQRSLIEKTLINLTGRQNLTISFRLMPVYAP